MAGTFTEWMHDGSQSAGVPFWAITQTNSGSNSTLRFYTDGRISTTKGDVLFGADIAALTASLKVITSAQVTYTSGTDPIAEGAWSIQRSFDPSTPSGYRYRMCGVSVNIRGEYHITVTYPMVLSGIFPGAFGATQLFVNEDMSSDHHYNDSAISITTAPTTSSMRIVSAQFNKPATDFPTRALWWIEGW